MKKLVAVLLVLLLVPCAGFAFAAEPEKDGENAELIAVEDQEMESAPSGGFYRGHAAMLRRSAKAQLSCGPFIFIRHTG